MSSDQRKEFLKAVAVMVLSATVLVLAHSNTKLKAEIKELWFRHDIIREEIESLYKARYRLENELQRLEEEVRKVG